MSTRENALQELYEVVELALRSLIPNPLVLRNETVPQRIPQGGIVMVRDGETVQETAILSPLRWQIEHRAEIDVIVTWATPAQRSEQLDILLVAVGAAIVAKRTLNGLVEWAQPGSPELQDVEFEGAATAAAALIPVTLWFTVAGSPLA